jgi:hypothetical protein
MYEQDFGLCCVYGFQKEAQEKYDEVIFSMFCEMFRHLPICSVIHNKVRLVPLSYSTYTIYAVTMLWAVLHAAI